MVERHPLAKAINRSEDEAMSKKIFPFRAQFGTTVAALAAVALFNAGAVAADVSADSLKLAPGVMKAPEGYETPTTKYIVANSTNVYSGHSFYDTKVTGELKRGEPVDVLAKVKGWEWVLVGKDGNGIGYVSISMLSPADKYVP
jgi:uncharacterized protein YgiM (DUF1202 family)